MIVWQAGPEKKMMDSVCLRTNSAGQCKTGFFPADYRNLYSRKDSQGDGCSVQDCVY